MLAGNDQIFEIELIFELKDIVGFKLANKVIAGGLIARERREESTTHYLRLKIRNISNGSRLKLMALVILTEQFTFLYF